MVYRDRAARAADIMALTAIAAVGLCLFRSHLMGRVVFIGDSDRLNTFLNILTFQVEALRGRGLSAWDPLMFMGLNVHALPYTFPNPLVWLTALTPPAALFWTAGVVSCALLVSAGGACYAFVKDTTGDVFGAWLGAVLYQCSALAVLKISQNDMSFAVLLHLPLALLAVRRLRDDNVWTCLLALTGVLTSLLYFTFLQKAAYAVLLIGGYALYRTIWLRSWRPVLLAGAALATAAVAAVPRVWTVGAETALLERPALDFERGSFSSVYIFLGTRPREFWRWLDEGIFGRFPTEAAALGNSINLHEGLLLYTSTFAALLVLVAIGRFRGRWLRLFRFRDEDAPFHLVTLGIVFLVVLWAPATHLVYLLFLSRDFTHARIVVAGLLPFCTLVAVIVESWLTPVRSLDPRRRAAVFVVGAVAAVLVLFGIEALVHRISPTDSVVLGESPLYLARVARDLVVDGRPPRRTPSRPRHVAAERPAAGTIALTWQDGVGENAYEVELRGGGGPFRHMARTRANTTRLVINDVADDLSYVLRIRACLDENCSRYVETLLPPASGELPVGGLVSPLGDTVVGTQLSAREMGRVTWVMIAFGILVCALRLARRRAGLTGVLGYTLAFLMAVQSASDADFALNGPQTRNHQSPFQGYDFMAADPDEFRLPSPAAVAAFHQRLESDDYRAATVCEPAHFAVFCAPHIAHFWRVRVAEGYSSGIPARLAALPWPPGVLSLRSISFPSVDRLPWDLLALLNVKYAVVVTREWYTNRTGAGHGGTREVTPGDVRVIENPFPVAPRAFFAASIQGAPHVAAALEFIDAGSARPRDLRVASVVEGINGSQRFGSAGGLRARYTSTSIEVDVEPAPGPRFLVVNELYHPAWRAYVDRREVPVYATNVVMRGLFVPAGVRHVTLRFQPFLYCGHRGNLPCHRCGDAAGQWVGAPAPSSGVGT